VKKVEKTIKTEKLKNNSEEDLTTENEIDFSELNEKIEQVLTALNNKIQISAVEKEIAKYTQLQSELSINPQDFAQKRIDELIQKADKIVQSQKEKNREYHIQSKPELKKGILKYQFLKPDKVGCLAPQQFRYHQRASRSVQDTEYDGTLNNTGNTTNLPTIWTENGFTIFITRKEIFMQIRTT
jgi:hypothetical protein